MSENDIGFSAIVIVFIAVVVGAIFLQTIAQNVGETTSTDVLLNDTQTLAANGSSIYLTNWRSLTDVIIKNATNETAVAIPSTNYTVTNNVVYNGALAVQITTTSADTSNYASQSVNISGTVQPLTYIDSAGSRSMANLIIIFFALAVGVIALYPTLKNKFDF